MGEQVSSWICTTYCKRYATYKHTRQASHSPLVIVPYAKQSYGSY